MAGTTIYRTPVQPDWIDYNAHLRDAYYGVAISLALDALMDRIGLDAEYRSRTLCTLYSLEMHIHWLREVKAPAELEIDAIVLAFDTKRLHLGLDVRVAGMDGVVAAAEVMLLHYRQGPTPGAAPFQADVTAALDALRDAFDGAAWSGPRSRALSLVKR
jgi:acyl-CoA thioester hydrolase